MLQEIISMMQTMGLLGKYIFYFSIPLCLFILAKFLQKKKMRVLTRVIAVFLIVVTLVGLAGEVTVDFILGTSTNKKEILNRSNIQIEEETVNYIEELEKYKEQQIAESSVDGSEIYYYVIRNREVSTNKYVVVLHGVLGDHYAAGHQINKFYEMGYNILALDLRGHGKSSGEYIGLGILDSRDLLDILEDHNKEEKDAKYCLYGMSMGAATVMTSLNLDLPESVKCVIEDSGYTSCFKEAWYHVTNNTSLPQTVMYFSDMFVKAKAHYSLFDDSALDGVENSQIPILFIHCREDEVVPVDMCYELYDACTAQKEMLILEGSGHVLGAYDHAEIYFARCKRFLAKYLK